MKRSLKRRSSDEEASEDIADDSCIIPCCNACIAYAIMQVQNHAAELRLISADSSDYHFVTKRQIAESCLWKSGKIVWDSHVKDIHVP
ncbi:MAG: hypothetical protein MZV63_28950 [Marinilabiliales bacterium]|nr:hypothetical protein [Marinilabiliales bacterium]